MAGLQYISDVVSTVRAQLKDTVSPYRYSDASILVYYNTALQNAKLVRPDLFLSLGYVNASLPVYTTGNIGEAVILADQYRTSLVYFIAGMLQLEEEEETTDTRAAVYITKFKQDLTGMAG